MKLKVFLVLCGDRIRCAASASVKAMGRINVKGSTLKWCRLIASCAFLTVVIAQGSHAKAKTVVEEGHGDGETVYTEPELCSEDLYGQQQRYIQFIAYIKIAS